MEKHECWIVFFAELERLPYFLALRAPILLLSLRSEPALPVIGGRCECVSHLGRGLDHGEVRDGIQRPTFAARIANLHRSQVAAKVFVDHARVILKGFSARQLLVVLNLLEVG